MQFSGYGTGLGASSSSAAAAVQAPYLAASYSGPSLSAYSTSATLSQLKEQFEQKRAAKPLQLWEVIQRTDPRLDEVEAKKLADRYSVQMNE
jgi:hypothetical protein